MRRQRLVWQCSDEAACETLASRWEYWFQALLPCGPVSDPASCLWAWEAAKDGPSTWNPCCDLGGVPGSSFRLAQTWIMWPFGELNPQMGDLSLSL